MKKSSLAHACFTGLKEHFLCLLVWRCTNDLGCVLFGQISGSIFPLSFLLYHKLSILSLGEPLHQCAEFISWNLCNIKRFRNFKIGYLWRPLRCIWKPSQEDSRWWKYYTLCDGVLILCKRRPVLYILLYLFPLVWCKFFTVYQNNILWVKLMP